MYYEKRYLQFNDLVFDGYDMISGYDESTQYKGSSTAYSYGHGSYRPLKRNYLFVSEKSVSMTISLKTKKLPCEYREYYVRFAEQELGKPGRLWAIKNNEIIWAFAVVSSIRPVNSNKKDEMTYDIEFIVPSGVWYKADLQRTFLLPYEVCSLMECKMFGTYNPSNCCNDEGCSVCEDNEVLKDSLCGCCCDDEATADMALGCHLKELQRFYSCDTPYQLKYDCDAAERFNTNFAMGQKICAEDMCSNGIISGRFVSNTDIPTEEMVITIRGKMSDPSITINGNTNTIEGEYDGILTIDASGDVYYQTNGCCEPSLLDPSVWTKPEGMEYGWTINPQWNGIVVNTNNCCSDKLACVYIDHKPITA